MYELLDLIKNNLIDVGFGFFIFLMAYLSNMSLGLWYNIKILDDPFEPDRIINSALKILSVGIGVVGLTVSITLIVPFAQEKGFPIPQEYADVINILATLGICLTASLKYIKESWEKLDYILNS